MKITPKAALLFLTGAAQMAGLSLILFGPVFKASENPVVAIMLSLLWTAVVGTASIHAGFMVKK